MEAHQTSDESNEAELAQKLDAKKAVSGHNAGEFDLSVDVRFDEGEMAHSDVIDLVKGHGYRIQYVAFENNSICFMKD